MYCSITKMADWESEDFDPDQGFNKPAATDRWDGEDEEEDVKDTWEDSDGEKKEAPTDPTGKATQIKKKKSLEATLKAKEEKRKKERAEKKLQEEKELTPEEQIAEKLRQQKLQEESDLELAKDTFGVGSEDSSRIDSFTPTTEEDFQKLGKLLEEKLQPLEKSPHYVDMLDALFQACSLSLEADQVKRLGTSLTAIASEKAKAQKVVTKSKKKSKKAVLAGSGKSGKGPGMDDDYDTYGNDMDDFM